MVDVNSILQPAFLLLATFCVSYFAGRWVSKADREDELGAAPEVSHSAPPPQPPPLPPPPPKGIDALVAAVTKCMGAGQSQVTRAPAPAAPGPRGAAAMLTDTSYVTFVQSFLALRATVPYDHGEAAALLCSDDIEVTGPMGNTTGIAQVKAKVFKDPIPALEVVVPLHQQSPNGPVMRKIRGKMGFVKFTLLQRYTVNEVRKGELRLCRIDAERIE